MSHFRWQPCVTSPGLYLDDGQGCEPVQGLALGIGTTGSPRQIESLHGLCEPPWTWCSTWSGGVECRGQHSRQPQVQGLRVAFPLCGVDLRNLEILVLINKSTEDFGPINRDYFMPGESNILRVSSLPFLPRAYLW